MMQCFLSVLLKPVHLSDTAFLPSVPVFNSELVCICAKSCAAIHQKKKKKKKKLGLGWGKGGGGGGGDNIVTCK